MRLESICCSLSRFHTISSGYHTLTSSVPSSTDVDYDENAAKKRLDDVDPCVIPYRITVACENLPTSVCVCPCVCVSVVLCCIVHRSMVSMLCVVIF